MKRKTAKEILADSFRELAQDMPIDRITIRDIIGNCGYSQATFYRQFRDKYDLIAWSYAQDLEEILSRLESREYTWQQTLEAVAAYIARHREYLSNLLTHTSGYDSFVFNMTAIHYKGVLKILERRSDPKGLSEMDKIQARIYVYGTVLFSCDWILGNYDLSEEELAKVYQEVIPDALWQFIK